MAGLMLIIIDVKGDFKELKESKKKYVGEILATTGVFLAAISHVLSEKFLRTSSGNEWISIVSLFGIPIALIQGFLYFNIDLFLKLVHVAILARLRRQVNIFIE